MYCAIVFIHNSLFIHFVNGRSGSSWLLAIRSPAVKVLVFVFWQMCICVYILCLQVISWNFCLLYVSKQFSKVVVLQQVNFLNT